MAEATKAAPKDVVLEVPAEVKPKRQPRPQQVWKTQAEMEAAHPEIKKKAVEKAKEKNRKRAAIGKQFRVTINGEQFFTIASGKKDAYARVCMYKGVELERLDAEAREPRSIKTSFEDVIAALQTDTKMPAGQRDQLAAALKKLQEDETAKQAAAAAKAPAPGK